VRRSLQGGGDGWTVASVIFVILVVLAILKSCGAV
jgi:hypothetical protein